MNISLVVQNPSPHQVALLDVLAGISEHQFRISYLKGETPNRGWGTPKSAIPEQRLPEKILASAGRKLNDWLSQQSADFWVVSTVYTSYLTHMLCHYLKMKKIPYVYMGEPPRPRGGIGGRAQYLLARNVISNAAGLITTGQESINQYKTFIDHELPTASVPYYPDTPLPRTAKPDLSGETIRFVCSAQLIERKGIDVLIRACEALPASGWSLDIFGSGPEQTRLKNLSKQNCAIGFKGNVPYESRNLMFKNADVFVFPTRWDGWGMVIPEAMGHGLPVITTDKSMSADEFVTHEVNGFIGPADSTSYLADSMSRFILNDVDYAAFSRAAVNALENYYPEVGAASLISLIERIHD